MEKGDAALLRRDRLVVAAVLFVLAVIVLALSYLQFNRSVGTPSGDEFHFGSINLLTDDPQARATLRVRYSTEYPDYITDNPLSIDIGIGSRRDEVAFALILTGDAARTGIEERSMSALPSGEGRGSRNIWAQGDTDEAWFVDGAGPTLAGTPPPPVGAVVVGVAHRSGKRGLIEVSMVVPTNGEFVRDTAGGFEFYIPTVGGRDGWFDGERLAARSPDELIPDPVAAPAAELIKQVSWQPLQRVGTEVILSGLKENDRIDATPPLTTVGLGERTWQASEPLAVSGIVDRPDDIQRAQRRQFVAGAAVGLGGALLVWAFEIILEVSLDARRARRAHRAHRTLPESRAFRRRGGT